MPELVSQPDKEWSVVIPCRGGCRYVYRYFASDLWVGRFPAYEGHAVERYYVLCGNCEKLHIVHPPDNVKSRASLG